MVNLEKWEKVTFGDLNKGDKIMRRSFHDDGTTSVVKGTLERKSMSGAWVSKDAFALVLSSYAFRTELYRRKPKPFIFPEDIGAVIQGHWVDTDAEVRLVSAGRQRWTSAASFAVYSEAALRVSLKDLTILSEGVSL